MSGELGCWVRDRKWMSWMDRVCISCWEGCYGLQLTLKIDGRIFE